MDGQTDTRLIAISPKPFGWGIKKTMHHKSSHIVAKKGNVNLYNMTKIFPGSDSLTTVMMLVLDPDDQAFYGKENRLKGIFSLQTRKKQQEFLFSHFISSHYVMHSLQMKQNYWPAKENTEEITADIQKHTYRCLNTEENNTILDLQEIETFKDNAY